MRGDGYRGGRGGNGGGRGRGNGGGRGRGGNGGGGGRGRGGRGRGGGGGGGRGRGGHGGGGGRGRGGRGRGGGHHRNRKQGFESGNQRERIQVESGSLVLIDQFMLANPQLLEQVRELLDAEPEAKNELIQTYGGTVVDVAPATYRIARDPFAFTIVIHPDGEAPEPAEVTDHATKESGRVFIDTRCVAMFDRELLDDVSLLEKYQQLWFGGQDKACRDLLRDNGGAVRYGFQRYGDELGVYLAPDENIVALWPDVTDAPVASEKASDSSAAASDEAQEAVGASA